MIVGFQSRFGAATLKIFPAVFLALLLSGCASTTGSVEESGKPATVLAEQAAAPAEVVADGEEPPSAPAENGGGFSDPFQEEGDADYHIADPIEPVNRGIFWFNDKFYTYLLKPVVKVYRFFIHETIRDGVANFFSNLATPVTIVNDALQLKAEDTGKDIFRFAVNSSLGLFGIMDVARDYGGVQRRTEDMGQTLGSYGVGHGFYVVLPIFGPSSVRDGMGTVVDYAFAPLTYADGNLLEKVGIKATDVVNDFAIDKDTYEALTRQSVDPYATFRDAYLQRRRSQLEK